jgi:putative transposase
MPRQARIDAVGAIHHIICRGIERRKIFLDDTDRNKFLSRLGNTLLNTGTPCFAWALLPNHFHLLLQTGKIPISTVMRKLLTGYAVEHNLRHHRVGHLFQNRYKSILCQKESYLLELVRYIHLNPLRAGIVTSMAELRHFRFCGHKGIVTGSAVPWQEIADILSHFGPSDARRAYDDFVAEGVSLGTRPDLIGGGLLRSSGGWQEVQWARQAGEFLKSDERILGDSEFVEEVLAAAKEHIDEYSHPHRQVLNLDGIAERVAELVGVDVERVWQPGKNRSVARARSLLCYWATQGLGISETVLAKKLSLTQSAVSKAATRGEQVAKATGIDITV